MWFCYALKHEVTQFDTGSEYKSRGERAIAGFLGERGIAFDYERPLAIMDRGYLRIWYPDFTLTKDKIIIEYIGMNGDSGYNKQIAHKESVYDGSDIDWIYLFESSLHGDWQDGVMERIEQVHKGRLNRIQQLRAKSRLVERV